eukprot:SAG11_NODE_274_length_11310_cov_4.717510_1_plen_57_part_00
MEVAVAEAEAEVMLVIPDIMGEDVISYYKEIYKLNYGNFLIIHHQNHNNLRAFYTS